MECVETISAGVKVDCAKLMERFDNTKSMLFKDFIRVWKSMKFSLIFCGRKTIYELLEFTEDLFLIAKYFLFPPNSERIRVGALYMLYGLYYKQPSRTKENHMLGYVRIRIRQSEWVELKQFVSKMKDEGRYDVAYIYYKMVLDKAFDFVCFPRQIIPEKWSTIGNEQIDITSEEAFMSTHQDFKPEKWVEDFLRDKGFLNPYKNQESMYTALKESIIEEDDDISMIALKTPGNTFILELLSGFYGSKNETEKNKDDIGDRRRALKNREMRRVGSSETSDQNGASTSSGVIKAERRLRQRINYNNEDATSSEEDTNEDRCDTTDGNIIRMFHLPVLDDEDEFDSDEEDMYELKF